AGRPAPLSLTQMRQDLAQVPVPTGASLVADYERPRRGSTPGTISRYYRYTGTTRPLCRVLLAAAVRAGYDVRTGSDRPVSAETCRATPPSVVVGPQAGVVELRARYGTAIRLGWAASEGIQVSISDTGTVDRG
ncbi:MAG: hypothetical protein J0H43_01830, partial [Actinobacteria bacterium]|nr:hypothetical protein [Actinomycetota bacterium]